MTNLGLTREEALDFVQEHIQNQNLIKHMLACEAAMRVLAEKLDGDVEAWGLAGLTHDVDYEKETEHPEKQGIVAAEMLEEKGVPKEVQQAVIAHNEMNGSIPESIMDKAIFAVDGLTGLIVSTTLVQPDKKLAGVTAESVLKKFKDKETSAKAFSRMVNREKIQTCESDLGIPLAEFVEIVLKAMQGVAGELGLS